MQRGVHKDRLKADIAFRSTVTRLPRVTCDQNKRMGGVYFNSRREAETLSKHHLHGCGGSGLKLVVIGSLLRVLLSCSRPQV
jgi:hypothetical protein